MWKIFQWLWNKAERTTADRILMMMRNFYNQPLPDPKNSEADKYQYQLMLHSRRDAEEIFAMIERRYFPSKSNNPINRRGKSL
jgi:hypothetical protein